MEILYLSPEQQEKVWKSWTEDQPPPSIPTLINKAWPELVNHDPRSTEGKVIKTFLIEKGAAPPTSGYKKKGDLILSPEQIEYINNNYITMKSVEMAQELFNNKNLSPVSQEARTIFNYVKTLKGEKTESKFENIVVPAIVDDIIPEKDYSPPTTIDRVCSKINKYVKSAEIDFRNLKASERKNCSSLISYLHNFRFIHQINSYFTESDRSLFESAFVEYTWDKYDLSSEDLDQYIILCNEKIMASNILKNINQLQREQQRIIDEEGKMSMTHVEALKSARTEYNDCVKRQQNLYKALTQQRSERLDNKLKDTSSILNLVELWKAEETRNKMIKIANVKKEKLSIEIDRLESLDDIIGTIFGLDKSEILNN
jgi:hypothetical protein